MNRNTAFLIILNNYIQISTFNNSYLNIRSITYWNGTYINIDNINKNATIKAEILIRLGLKEKIAIIG